MFLFKRVLTSEMVYDFQATRSYSLINYDFMNSVILFHRFFRILLSKIPTSNVGVTMPNITECNNIPETNSHIDPNPSVFIRSTPENNDAQDPCQIVPGAKKAVSGKQKDLRSAVTYRKEFSGLFVLCIFRLLRFVRCGCRAGHANSRGSPNIIAFRYDCTALVRSGICAFGSVFHHYCWIVLYSC